jgi:chromosome segregation ATPase
MLNIPHSDIQAQQRQIREYLVAAESRIARTEEDIAQETQRLADINGGNYARKQDEIDQRRSEVSQTRHDYDEHVQDAHRLRESLRAAEEEVKRNVAPLSKQKSDIEETENLLKTLLRDRGQTDAGFHERMPMLLRAIRQDSSFSRSPVGPIGRHVTLLEPKWSSILEASLNTTLSSFIVTSKRDMNVLSDIMQRVNWYD